MWRQKFYICGFQYQNIGLRDTVIVYSPTLEVNPTHIPINILHSIRLEWTKHTIKSEYPAPLCINSENVRTSAIVTADKLKKDLKLILVFEWDSSQPCPSVSQTGLLCAQPNSLLRSI